MNKNWISNNECIYYAQLTKNRMETFWTKAHFAFNNSRTVKMWQQMLALFFFEKTHTSQISQCFDKTGKKSFFFTLEEIPAESFHISL